MHASELWNGEEPGAKLARALLTPLSWLYAAGWQGYLGLYKFGIRHAKKPHRKIIVVGNLTTGGSGKSPVTKHVAELLQEMGHPVILGCSGYGSSRAEAASLAPAGPLAPSEWGDEPSMFRWLLPDVPMVVGRRRVLAAELAAQSYPDSVLLMDDGFQHLPLRTDLQLVLDDPSAQNTQCLPAGPYREPQSNLSRASTPIWTEGEKGFRVKRQPQRFVWADLTPAKVQQATVICALGNPRKFLADLAAVVQIKDPLLLADHDPLTSGTLFDRIPRDLPVVVTAKDWVKLRERTDLPIERIVIALQDVAIAPEAEFRLWLKKNLE